MARTRGRRAQEFRAALKAEWQARNAPCGICGIDDIDWDGEPNEPNSFELEHRLPIKTYPLLEFEPSNCEPSHHRCNRAKGDGKAVPPVGITSEAW